ncbi:MAG: EamA family transporter [Candidatus Saccharimonadales bacterium]
MVWLWIPIAAAFCYAISGFIDNFLVDTYCKKKNPKCMSIIYVAIELVICVVVAIASQGAVFTGVGWGEIGIFLLAALVNFFGSIPYYRALKDDETTEVALLSQMSPVMALGLGFVFLNEVIGAQQLVGFFMILAMAVFIVVGSGRRRFKMKATAGICMVIACFFWVMSDIIFVFQAREVDFVASIFWLMMGGVISNVLAFIVMRSWRKDLKSFLARKRGRKISIIVANELVCLAGEVLWRFGVVVMPVAIMSVTGNVAQLIITFILGVVLTLIVPKFGREKLSKKVVANHALAMGVIAIAVVLLG